MTHIETINAITLESLADSLLAQNHGAPTSAVLGDVQALLLADVEDTRALMAVAAQLRDASHRNLVTYSRKVFIPLTHLCRDVCHYCTFAQTPKKLKSPYMSVDEVLAIAREGAKQGCKEALFTLGEKPELRYNAARKALEEMGYATTLQYVAAVAKRVFDETGLFPHINAGCMSSEELAMLRPVSASMGIMLESTAPRLCEKGGPHYGSPDKVPAVRLETIRRAGEAKVPFTSGILIGIGETRRERIESLLALRDMHERYGHIQEIIVQNFRAKPNTLMSQAPEPDLNEMLWTLAVTRIIFGPAMSVQAPPNLSPGVLGQLIDAGINDWGGVSPVTPDFVNPEAPWPHLDKLARETAVSGKFLQERLTIYPDYAVDNRVWLDEKMITAVLQSIDTEGYPRIDDWETGSSQEPPQLDLELLEDEKKAQACSEEIKNILARVDAGHVLAEHEIIRLFQSRGEDFAAVCQAANRLRREVNGDTVSYVVNRNINYTNVCYFKCQFCAFSKGKLSENLRGRPYDLSETEIMRRTQEAWQRGATEVCMQGGINPDYTGQTYIDICHMVKRAANGMHVHAFSPLEIWQGAQTLGITLKDFMQQLIAAGLATLPGTAAEILDDEVRAILCPDKINTDEWLEVMETAHSLGMKTTATMMFGHVERLEHWARHLIRVRDLQHRSGGFTEFVPLPFVASEAPIYLKGKSRKGPTFRESILLHAVARLVFHGSISNIQASWVKLGKRGVQACLNAGVNDLGGTLMNETITKSAGATHGQETSPAQMESRIRECQRAPLQRTTLYGSVPPERVQASFDARDLGTTVNDAPQKRALRDKKSTVIAQSVMVK